MADQETYSRDELTEMSRVDLRRIAVQIHGMNNRECSGSGSADIIDFIIEAQDGGGGKKGSKKVRSGKKKKTSKKAKTSKGNGEPPPKKTGSSG